MVHALKKVHRLLRPGGILIDIHGSGDPRPVEVLGEGRASRVGLLVNDVDASKRRATAALAQIVAEGWFFRIGEITYPFRHHFASLAVMRDWVAENCSGAILDDETAKRAEVLLSAGGSDAELVLSETVTSTRLEAQVR